MKLKQTTNAAEYAQTPKGRRTLNSATIPAIQSSGLCLYIRSHVKALATLGHCEITFGIKILQKSSNSQRQVRLTRKLVRDLHIILICHDNASCHVFLRFHINSYYFESLYACRHIVGDISITWRERAGTCSHREWKGQTVRVATPSLLNGNA